MYKTILGAGGRHGEKDANEISSLLRELTV